MLLAPYSGLPVYHNLCVQDAFHAFIEGRSEFFAHFGINEVPKRCFSVAQVTYHLHGLHHGIIVVGDVNLVSMVVRPELRPSTILVLAAQHELNSFQESLFVFVHVRPVGRIVF